MQIKLSSRSIGNIYNEFFAWLVLILVSWPICQFIENTMATSPDFIFKPVIQLIVPGPEDGVIEFMQWLLYVFGAIGARIYQELRPNYRH